MQDYRYTELHSDAACLDVLADGEWRAIGDVQKELGAGGRPLERGSVRAVLNGLEQAGRLEGKRARTGWQGGEKRYRLRSGSDSG